MIHEKFFKIFSIKDEVPGSSDSVEVVLRSLLRPLQYLDLARISYIIFHIDIGT